VGIGTSKKTPGDFVPFNPYTLRLPVLLFGYYELRAEEEMWRVFRDAVPKALFLLLLFGLKKKK